MGKVDGWSVISPRPWARSRLCPTYIHSGEVDTPKQDAKFAFLSGMDKYLAKLARSAKKNGNEVLVCGDFNIGHREVDIKNWKGNRGKSRVLGTGAGAFGFLVCKWLDGPGA